MTDLLQRMADDLRLRNYSLRTEATYVAHVDALGRHFHKSPADLELNEIRNYLLYIINVRQCSWSWWRQAVAALRFFYGITLGLTDVVPYLPYPRREFHLPHVLSPAEVERLFRVVHHPRPKAVLMTIYACGLRTSEALALTPGDIDPERMMIHVRQGKGRKDRLVPLSPVLLDLLRQYWRKEGIGRWVFPGRQPDQPLASGWVQYVTRKAGERAGLRKRVTPRTLRHSYATHLLEAGVDLRIIQKLLGHASILSTVVYAHVTQDRLANICSPLDNLDLVTVPRQLVLDGM